MPSTCTVGSGRPSEWRRCTPPGLGAFGWDAQTRAEISSLLDAGIDGVYSDHAGLLAAARSRPGRDRPAGRRQATGTRQSQPRRDSGQTRRKARPMNSFFGIGPMIRESAESPRLSPIMKYSPFGTWTGPKSAVTVTLRQPRLVQLVPVDVDVPVLGRDGLTRAGR